jgi:phage baseplate assembly protein W
MSDELLGTDILLVDGDFDVVPTGDVETTTGRACLAQDLMHRLSTPLGDLMGHPDYGFDIYRFLHQEMTPVHLLDFQRAVEDTVYQDPRVEPDSAQVTEQTYDLERIRFRLECRAIGESNPINLVLAYDLTTITLEVVRGS